MGIAFKQFFMAVTVLFAAFEAGAKALLHLCRWSEETAGSFYDEASDARVIKQNERRLAMGITPEADQLTTKVKSKTKVVTEE